MYESNSFNHLGVKRVRTSVYIVRRKITCRLVMTHTSIEVNDFTKFPINIEAGLELGAPTVSSKETSSFVLPFIPLITWNSWTRVQMRMRNFTGTHVKWLFSSQRSMPWFWINCKVGFTNNEYLNSGHEFRSSFIKEYIRLQCGKNWTHSEVTEKSMHKK